MSGFEPDFSKVPLEVLYAIKIWNQIDGVLDPLQIELRAELSNFQDVTLLIHLLDTIKEHLTNKAQKEE